MRRRPRRVAPDGFVNLLREGMDRQRISLNQLAYRAGVSPAFLSRILNRERGLPSDKIILRFAKLVDLEPPERLLIEAGRIPEELQSMLSQPQIPDLLRAADKLSETELEQLVKTVQALALKQHQARKRR